MARVDVVVVSYNSADVLRQCVEPLAHDAELRVLVVDNASPDGPPETVADLSVELVQLDDNYGFAAACNRGSARGDSPFVLFLNPDARIEPESIRRLVSVLEEHERCALVAPQILSSGGQLEHSLRRRPRLVSTYAQALFLHRLFPRLPWTDELIRDPRFYSAPTTVEWVSGACVLARRSMLEAICGWDDEFFLYGEDIDLCRRAWEAGFEVRYEPQAKAVHIGGTSAPSARMAPTLVRGRIRYVKKHEPALVALLHQAGLALGSLTHALLTTKGGQMRLGHAKAFLAAVSFRRRPSPRARQAT